MDTRLQEKLEKAGDELRARHDDAIIADVIGEVESMEGENTEITADLLRKMVGFDETE
jgi:hypothetical protein